MTRKTQTLKQRKVLSPSALNRSTQTSTSTTSSRPSHVRETLSAEQRAGLVQSYDEKAALGAARRVKHAVEHPAVRVQP